MKMIKMSRLPFSKGMSMIETILVFPILMFIGMTTVHLALLYQAKANLEYAALMGARVAAARGYETQDKIDRILTEVRYRMEATDPIENQDYSDGALLADVSWGSATTDKIRLTIVRPNQAMFSAFGVGNCGGAGLCVIPNANLASANPNWQNLNVNGQVIPVSLQDANILTLRVSYLVDTKVPFMRPMNAALRAATGTPPRESELPGGADGIWVSAESSVIMQTESIRNPFNNFMILP